MAFHLTNDTVSNVENYAQNVYTGTVTANDHPTLKGLGLIQATVPGLWDTQTGEVPWIGPDDRGSPFGYGAGYGFYGVPPIGATVKVSLQNGDPHKPLYSNFHSKANVNQQFTTPNVWGYQDADGNIMMYDSQAHSYRFVTKGGVVVTIDGNGNRTTTVKDDTVNSSGNVKIIVSGNANIQCTDFNMTASGTATYTAVNHQFNGAVMGSTTIQSQGDMTDCVGKGNTRTMADFRRIYDGHDHPVPNVQGGNDTATSNIPNQQV